VDSKKIKVLFISEATITGAPLLLLNIVKELVKESHLEVAILVKRDGELVSEFKQLAKTYVLKGARYRNLSPSTFQKLSRFADSLWNRLRIYPKLSSTQVIVSNTVTHGRILQELNFLGAPVICYVHELQNTIEAWRPKKDVTISLLKSDLFVVPSEYIKNSLQKNNNISPAKVRIFDTYIPFEPFNDLQRQKQQAKSEFCRKRGIPEDSFLIVGMGIADRRKGIDLFIQTASKVQKLREHVYFTWIGSFLEKEIKELTQLYYRNEDSGNVIFTGQIPHSLLNLLPFDLFFLSSREDPYPLVVLEAAALEIPTACFDGSGGTVDFVANGCGFLIKDWSTEEASRSILYLSNNRQALCEAGSNSFRKFQHQHTDVELMKSQFFEFINQVLKIEKPVK
jgi:glycosyltransferase involved in cell wall biosynthesis